MFRWIKKAIGIEDDWERFGDRVPIANPKSILQKQAANNTNKCHLDDMEIGT